MTEEQVDYTPTSTNKHQETTETTLQAHLAQLSNEQLRFVLARLRASSARDAAKATGISEGTISHWPAYVGETVTLLLLDTVAAARALMVRTLAQAMAVKVHGLESKDEKVKQAAASELLDRSLGRAAQTLDLKHDLSAEARKFLAELMALGTGEDESTE